MDKYTYVDGKKMKNGYTTGTCAQAAAKAALMMALNKEIVPIVKVATNSGDVLYLEVQNADYYENGASCAICKDAGDDPDVTNGMLIYAKVDLRNDKEINITGGKGIGMVTKPGLAVKPSFYAINPVPMKMIKKELTSLLNGKLGVDVTIYAPKGMEIAKKTLNHKLGINGGISILGTTGIVTPMSKDAYKKTICIEMDMMLAKGGNEIRLAFGNIGMNYLIIKNKIEKESILKVSNFLGHALDYMKVTHKNISKIYIAGHIGKMIKVAGGIFQTHSKTADARLEILAAFLALEHAPYDLIEDVYYSNTTDEAVMVIRNSDYMSVFKRVGDTCIEKILERISSAVSIELTIFDGQSNKLYEGERIYGE